MTSGDLFKVEVVNRTPHQWLTPAGQLFNSEEFVVTLDEDMFVGAALSYRVTGMWWLRAVLSYSKVDATAEALVGESVELFLYDRLAFLMAGLVVERPLVATPSYPFLLAGVAWVKLTAEHASELDQDGLGIRFGAGYNHNFGGLWCLRFEIRDTVKQIDTLAHQPTTTEPIEVDTNYTEAGPQNLFEISLMVRGRFH